jgi:spore coat protein U-like protein
MPGWGLPRRQKIKEEVMKKNLFVTMAAITLVIAMVGGAYAATTTGSVSATATVLAAPGVCTISGAPALGFGNVDEMSNAGGATAAVTAPDIRCTNALVVGVTDDLGANELGAQMRLTDGANFINYSISYTGSLTGGGAGVNIGDGANPELGLTAGIPAGALTGKPAGNYTDTVVLTLTY